MSQTALAKALSEHGVKAHMTTVAKIEAGDRSIRLNEAVALSRVLGIDLPIPATVPIRFQIVEAAAQFDRLVEDCNRAYLIANIRFDNFAKETSGLRPEDQAVIEQSLEHLKGAEEHMRLLKYHADCISAVVRGERPPHVPEAPTKMYYTFNEFEQIMRDRDKGDDDA